MRAVEFTHVSSSSSISITENFFLKNQQKNQQGLASAKQAGINLIPLAYHPATKAPVYIWDDGGRPIVVVNMGGFTFPFYNSSGQGGKQSVAIGNWYPFFGIGPGGIGPGWFNKGSEEDINNYYGSEKLKQIAQILDNTLGRPPREPNNVFGWMDHGKGQEANALKVINNGLMPQKTRDLTFNRNANYLLRKVGGKLYPEGYRDEEDRAFYNSSEFLDQIGMKNSAQKQRDEEDRAFYNSPEFRKQIGMAETTASVDEAKKRKRKKHHTPRSITTGWWGGYYGDNSSGGEGGGGE